MIIEYAFLINPVDEKRLDLNEMFKSYSTEGPKSLKSLTKTEIDDGFIFIKKASLVDLKGQIFWRIDITRSNLDNIPPAVNDDGTESDLPLTEGQGLGQIMTLLYHINSKMCIFSKNWHCITNSGLSSFLSKLYANYCLSEPFIGGIFSYIIFAFDEEQLLESERIASFHIKAKSVVAKKSNLLGKWFNSMIEYGCDNIDVRLSLDSRKKSLSKGNVVALISEAIDYTTDGIDGTAPLVTSLEATIKPFGSNSDKIDLIKNRLKGNGVIRYDRENRPNHDNYFDIVQANARKQMEHILKF